MPVPAWGMPAERLSAPRLPEQKTGDSRFKNSQLRWRGLATMQGMKSALTALTDTIRQAAAQRQPPAQASGSKDFYGLALQGQGAGHPALQRHRQLRAV